VGGVSPEAPENYSWSSIEGRNPPIFPQRVQWESGPLSPKIKKCLTAPTPKNGGPLFLIKGPGLQLGQAINWCPFKDWPGNSSVGVKWEVYSGDSARNPDCSPRSQFKIARGILALPREQNLLALQKVTSSVQICSTKWNGIKANLDRIISVFWIQFFGVWTWRMARQHRHWETASYRQNPKLGFLPCKSLRFPQDSCSLKRSDNQAIGSREITFVNSDAKQTPGYSPISTNLPPEKLNR